MKLINSENFEIKKMNWKLSEVAMNEFLMSSNLTFHTAALEFIRKELVQLLTFTIFYME